MSLTDPLSITISGINGGAANSLPETESEGRRSVYQNADGTLRVTASHQTTGGERTRTMLRLDLNKITSNPFDTSQNMEVETAVYVVFDTPPAGYTDAEVLAAWNGFSTMLNASSAAMVTKLLAGEH